MIVSEDIEKTRKIIRQAKNKGETIGFVPTMGALHSGHLSLVSAARKDTDFTVVSIFVNPSQFRRGEDLSSYPRPFAQDKKVLEKTKADLLFLPSPKDMYPEDFSTWVEELNLSRDLCGISRLGHFKGVCTVVAKLFNIILPDISYFGAKDFQQARVIKRMSKDLNFPVEIKVMPIVREKDGLAMSSRNAYLKGRQRQDALLLNKAIMEASRQILAGQRNPRNIVSSIEKIIGSSKEARIDYVKIVRPDTLREVDKLIGDIVIVLAVFIGNTRLIDNLELKIKD